MYRGKYRRKSQRRSRKSTALLVSLLLVFVVGVGGTIAFLTDSDGPLKNLFNPSKITTTVVEEFNGETKSNVKIKNTGDTTAWIRAAVVITWQDKDGNVYGQAPVKDTDYTISYKLGDGWTQGNDGFYYWTEPVKSEKEAANDCLTGVLIETCTYKKEKAPKGYFLTVEIIGSGIQSIPSRVFDDNWGTSSGLKVNSNGNALVEGGAGN